jgi:CRISPR-associated protein Cas5h
MIDADRCLIFDLWGDYAHFRSIYSTSSPLTYSFSPKPSIIGILSAILGFDKRDYLNKFYNDKFWIALQIINPIKKIRITENFYDVKKWDPNKRVEVILGNSKEIKKDIPLVHTQIRLEMLKDPKYRIFFKHGDLKLMDKLKSLLENHAPEYTVTLGLSENLANFEYIGEDGYEFIDNKDFQIFNINSVIKKNVIVDGEISLESGISIDIENMPVEMNQERIVSEYAEYVCERDGKPLNTKVTSCIKINESYFK